MSELTPCPECQRHVRHSEQTCPFCGQALALSRLPAQALPRSRLGRAATFAFGATLVSATALVGCGGEAEGKQEGEGGSASGGTAGDSASGSANAGQSPGGSGAIVPLYGAPAAGSGASGGNPGVPIK